MNPQKNKGDKAEREVAALLTELTGKTVRRKLGAGRTNAAGGDTGDIELENFAIQVCDWKDKSAACLQKPVEAEQQKIAAAEKRIIELKTLIQHWRKKENGFHP